MTKTIYIINPAADFPTYFGAEVYGAWGKQASVSVAELAITTLAAFVPPEFTIELCDENLEPARLDVDADYVALTGKVSQSVRMRELAEAYRARGKVVVIGGPFASLCPDQVRDCCDVLVRGEIEEIAPKLFADLLCGDFQQEYEGTRPSLDMSPIPRWDLYPNDRAKSGTVQTSRSCPFECEFCDVIEYLGRKQRHKRVEQVLEELDVLYAHGYRSVFMADDNFTAARNRAKSLLAAIRDWNLAQSDGHVTFVTQLSIDAAQDDEILRLCSEAGLTHAFVGIETPNEASLRGTNKKHNTGVNLVDQVKRFYAHGIAVFGGMIVGFDQDGPDIFQRQQDFLREAAIPFASVGTLVAPPATTLYRRLKEEGRLLEEAADTTATPWSTNMVPKLLTGEELLSGMRELTNEIYDPEVFCERVLDFIELLGERRDPRYLASVGSGKLAAKAGPGRSIDQDGRKLLRVLRRLGPREAAMVTRILEAATHKPQAFEYVLYILHHYIQLRYMYDLGGLWDGGSRTQASPVGN